MILHEWKRFIDSSTPGDCNGNIPAHILEISHNIWQDHTRRVSARVVWVIDINGTSFTFTVINIAPLTNNNPYTMKELAISMYFLSQRRNTSYFDVERVHKSHHWIRHAFIAVGMTLLCCCVQKVTAQDEFPTVQLPDVPIASSPISPMASRPSNTATAPSGGFGTTPVVAPSAPVIVNVAPTRTTNSTPAATITPTITFQPTISAFPTITPYPTYTACNICINGVVTVQDIIPLEAGNVTCLEVASAGRKGLISATNCEFLQELIFNTSLCQCRATDAPTMAPTYTPCNICGDGYYVANIEGELILNPSTNETATCGFVNQGGIAGLLSPNACDYITNQTSPTRNTTRGNPCSCTLGTMPPTPATCNVCGNASESVTVLNATVEIPKEAIGVLLIEANVTPDLFTCEFVESQFSTSTELDGLVCAYLQMAVSDVCGCQVLENVAPVASPTSATNGTAQTSPTRTMNVTESAPTSATNITESAPTSATNRTSSAPLGQAFRWSLWLALSFVTELYTLLSQHT
jgi:hypothetical protein